MSVKKLSKRCVWHFAMTYASPIEFNPAISKCDHYAYIYHDKDDCEPHYHLLMHFPNARSGHAVLRDFVSLQNTMIEPCFDVAKSYDYLIHVNEPDKFQYSKDLIVTDSVDYWEKFLPRIRDQNQLDFLGDLLSDDLDLVDMACKYGRDFIKNYKSYLEFRNLALIERKNNFND